MLILKNGKLQYTLAGISSLSKTVRSPSDEQSQLKNCPLMDGDIPSDFHCCPLIDGQTINLTVYPYWHNQASLM